jgi:hypothetical protein
MLANGGGPAQPEPPAAEPAEGEGGEASAIAPDQGPGVVEGEEPRPAEAVGAMGDQQPVGSQNSAPVEGTTD